jgi:hypothetical protein
VLSGAFSTRLDEQTHIVDSIGLAVEVLVCQLLQLLLQVFEGVIFIVGSLYIAADLLELLYLVLGLSSRRRRVR